MADEHPVPPRSGTVRIAEADGEHAVLAFTGDLDTQALRELEALLLDRRLRRAGTWVLDMSGLVRLDLACAYALLRAATRAPEPAALTVRGARRDVQRTLRRSGVDAVATVEE
ncbi:STAS domain-containing protein [Streptomyces griseus]|uniref:STAS domain-containing protein n=1 Tax=Streptomyces griseus TaxID=1911 RepID=UPI000689BF9D|nr:STAS domain-containing protein [Streptomyces griseus]